MVCPFLCPYNNDAIVLFFPSPYEADLPYHSYRGNDIIAKGLKWTPCNNNPDEFFVKYEIISSKWDGASLDLPAEYGGPAIISSQTSGHDNEEFYDS
jgi:hypothetical protein